MLVAVGGCSWLAVEQVPYRSMLAELSTGSRERRSLRLEDGSQLEMNAGTALLKPLLASAGVVASGRVVIGTVKGDLHDIGKNLVKMMMEGKGLEVVDLGTDVAPETYVQTAVEQGCQIICCSALLTTTMGMMEEVVKKAEEAGIRDKVKIMVGGAPVTEAFCEQIGADKYTADAASAADAAVALCRASA